MTIEEAILRLQKGNRKAFKRVYDEFSIPILKLSISMTIGPNSLEKSQIVLQDIFTKFYNQKEYVGLTTPKAIEEYLIQQVKKYCITRDKDKILKYLSKQNENA